MVALCVDELRKKFDAIKSKKVGREGSLLKLRDELSKINDIEFSNPMGAFYSIIKLPVKNAEDFAKFLLTDFSINNESVMVAPASGFYSSENNGEDEVRIAFVLNSEKIKRAINIINIGLKEYTG